MIESTTCVPDPAAVQGSDLETSTAFREVFRVLDNQIKIFTSLPLGSVECIELKERLDEIGRMRER